MTTRKPASSKSPKSPQTGNGNASRGSPASESLFRHYHAGMSFAELMCKQVDAKKYAKDLREKMAAAGDNDLRRQEMMLAAQADTLDAIFSSLAWQAASADIVPKFQAYMTLALKAQAQCRATVEALAEIKNPRPVAFVRQANIANGPQQVNNGVSPDTSRAPARKGPTSSNELLEYSDGERLDGRPSSEAGRGDQTLETVGALYRAKD